MKLLQCLALSFLLTVAACGIQVTVSWTAPPQGSNTVDGYNLYFISETAPVTPNTYVKINTNGLITALQFSFDAQPGQSIVVRAANIFGESQDSNVYTFPNGLPSPPSGLKPSLVTVQSSTNLIDWANLAVVGVPTDTIRGFFRLTW